MTRNVIKSDNMASKMAAGGHFVSKFPKNILHIDLKW